MKRTSLMPKKKKLGKKIILKLYNLDDLGRYFTVSNKFMQYIANSKR